MAVTSKNLRSVQRTPGRVSALPRQLHAPLYGLALALAVLAAYAAIGLVVDKAQVFFDDLRYGRPRTTHLTAFVGHDEAAGQPSHLMAMNLDRQIVVLELPGGDPSKVRTINGPYLVGAEEDLTPVNVSLHDIDADGHVDLLLDVRREQIVYLNKDGAFRLPTPEEQVLLSSGSSQ